MGTQQLQRFKPFSLLLSLAKCLLDETLITIQILVKNFHKQHDDVDGTIIVHLLNHFTPLHSSPPPPFFVFFFQKSKGISKWWQWLHSHSGSPLDQTDFFRPGVVTTLGTKMAFNPQTTYPNLCMLPGVGGHCLHLWGS